MHLHFLTLKRQTDFLREKIASASIQDSFTQVKNEWILHLLLPEKEEFFLQLSCHPRFPFIIINDSIKRQKNSTVVMEELPGSVITDLQIVPGERILEMTFDKTGQKLMLHFFTTNSNFFLIDQSRSIINSFKKSKSLKGTTYSIPESSRLDISALSSSEFTEMAKRDSEKKLLSLLKKSFFHVNQTVAHELLFRQGISPDAVIQNLTSDQLAKLHRDTIDFLKECEKGQPRIYFREKLPHLLSLTQLDHAGDLEEEIFDDINSALRFFNFQSIKYQVLIQKKNNYLKSLTQRIQYLEKTAKKLIDRKDEPNKKAYYTKIAQLILAQPKAIKKGEATALLVDYYDPQMPEIQVKINPKLNAQENAQMFFSNARSFDQKQVKRTRRAKEIQAQLKSLHQMKDDLESVDSYKALEKIELKLKSDNLIPKSEDEAAQLRLPFKKFTFRNWEIWVGRSAKDNDAMTFKHAHKEDWWLHVQGYSGSHVVIRNPQRRNDVPPDILHRAASLAVTHSDAKHASYVPVIYTRVKFVQKPRKSAPGSVIPSQTKTIYADPIKST